MEHHVFEYLKMITDQYLGKDQTTTRSLQNGQDLGFELNTFRNVVGGGQYALSLLNNTAYIIVLTPKIN